MVEKKQNFEIVSYVLGIVSIVMAFFSPVAAIVFGIIGINLSKKQKTELSKRAKKFSIIGIILGVILLIVSILAIVLNLESFTSFPA